MSLIAIVLLIAKLGVQTPGVQIPITKLKPEAQITLSGTPESILADQTVWVPNRAKNTLDRIDPKANTLAEPITGLNQPCGAPQLGFGDVWVLNCGDGTLSRIDSKAQKLKVSIKTGAGSARTGLAITSDSVWVLTDDKTTLSRIDPDQNKVVGELRLPASCNTIISGESALWVTCPAENRVLRIDPITNLVTERIEVLGEPYTLAVGEGSVWVLTRKEGKVERIDPKTNKATKTIELLVPDSDGDIAVGEGSVWVTLRGFPISRIDPKADKVVQQFVGDGGGVIRTGQGAVWLTNSRQGTVWKLEPRRIAATLAE
jgi:virginiamycin B lyase